jgi:Aldo/keto reductase family
VILAVGAVWGSAYELYAHSAVASSAGLPAPAVQVLAAGEMPGQLTAAEQAAWRFTHQLTTQRHVEQPVYDKAYAKVTTIGLGIEGSPLTLGGSTFGWTSDEITSRQVLASCLDAGGNLIDTSDSYSAFAPGNSGGESETIIGARMATHRNRDRVVIGTKVSQHPEFTGLSAANVAAAADASLKRLGTDYIDRYWAHYGRPALRARRRVRPCPQHVIPSFTGVSLRIHIRGWRNPRWTVSISWS